MPLFTPILTLPEGTVYRSDLTEAAAFSDWLDEFSQILAAGCRFAVMSVPERREIPHEQHVAGRKAYFAWIKANQNTMRERCAAMVVVETDPEEYRLAQEQVAGLRKSFRLNYIVEDSETVALASAEAALKQAFAAD